MAHVRLVVFHDRFCDCAVEKEVQEAGEDR
jgi:hypothetical protein